MAILNVALAAATGGAPGNPQYIDIVTLDLSAGYTAGGWADFSVSVQDAIGKGKTIQTDRTTDKLVCVTEALIEVAPAGDLSGVVGLELVIISN